MNNDLVLYSGFQAIESVNSSVKHKVGLHIITALINKIHCATTVELPQIATFLECPPPQQTGFLVLVLCQFVFGVEEID